MYYRYKFTVIMYNCINQDNIERSIRGIVNQKINFKRNVQLIILNNNSSSNIINMLNYYSNKYPKNITIIPVENNNLSSINGLYNEIMGKYVTVLDSEDYFSINSLNLVHDLFEGNDVDIVKIPVNYINGINKRYNEKYSRNIKVNLLANPNRFLNSFKALFFKSSVFNHEFNDKLTSCEALEFVYDLLLDNPKYSVCSKPRYFNRREYLDTSYINNKNHYNYRLNNFHLKLINKSLETGRIIPTYIQKFIVNDIANLMEINEVEILNDNEINQLWDTIKEIISKISFNVIKTSRINKNIKTLLIYLKNNKKIDIVQEDGNIQIHTANYHINNSDNIRILLDDVYTADDKLYLNASLTTFIEKEHINVKLVSQYDNQTEEYDLSLYENSNKYLSKNIFNTYEFDTNIKLNSASTVIYFKVEYNLDNIENQTIPRLSYELTSSLYATNNFKSDDSTLQIYKLDNTRLKIIPYVKAPKNYLFSIIMAVYNTRDYLQEAIDSVINQTINFERYTQLILVDDGSTDNSLEILEEYQKKYPNNIIVLTKTHEGVSAARNWGLKQATGKYINFLDSDDILSKNALKEIKYCFDKNRSIDIVTIPIKYIEMSKGFDELNYKFNKRRVIDLNKHPNYPQISISSTFIRKNALNNYIFNEDLQTSEDTLLINRLLIRKPRYYTTDRATYFMRKRSGENALSDVKTEYKSYYIDRLNNFHIPLINQSIKKGKVPRFIQYLITYDLNKIVQNESLDILTNNEQSEFKELLKEILSYITYLPTITKNRNIKGHERNYLLYLKDDQTKTIIETEDNVIQKVRNFTLDSFNRNKIGLDIIEIKHGFLTIHGYLNTCFSSDNITIELIEEGANNTIIHTTNLFSYPQKDRKTKEFLSTPWKYNHNFEFKLKLNDIINTRLYFNVRYSNGEYTTQYYPELGLRLPSNLSTTGIYMIKESKIVFFKENSLHIKNYSYLLMLRLEFSVIRKIIRDKKEGYISIFLLRLIYVLLYPIMKNKRIWLFNDRPLIADDNAKHLFKYSIKQDDNVKKYYILNKESNDFNTMKQISKNTIEFGSLKHKFLFLNAEKHISAFVNEEYRNPFYTPGGFDYRRSFSGLATTQRYFLQHGVTLGNVTRSLKKYNTNLSLIVCGSEIERNSFFQWDYNYDKEIINVLGLPRYDNLTTDNTKKQIVFMPTWRANLKDKTTLFNSDFYKSLISFINNEKMHQNLIEKGYEFVFKPHPELLKYLEYMQLNDNIKISLEDSYQDLFRDSSILITDYSSVAFDFAYLKKPVIYYQPNDDYPYEKGYFIFEEMGFGDVIQEETTIINKINTYLENNCQMEDKYKQRVSNFFKYTDKNNCKRVYNWILND